MNRDSDRLALKLEAEVESMELGRPSEISDVGRRDNSRGEVSICDAINISSSNLNISMFMYSVAVSSFLSTRHLDFEVHILDIKNIYTAIANQEKNRDI